MYGRLYSVDLIMGCRGTSGAEARGSLIPPTPLAPGEGISPPVTCLTAWRWLLLIQGGGNFTVLVAYMFAVAKGTLSHQFLPGVRAAVALSLLHARR